MSALLSVAVGLYEHWMRVFSRPSRTVIALSLLAFFTILTTVPPALEMPSGADDVNWAKRSLEPWWFPLPRIPQSQWSAEYTRSYRLCVDHPSLARIVYREVLHAAGIRTLAVEEWDYSADATENVAKGRLLPYRPRTYLRMTNVALFMGAVVVLYFGLNAILSNAALALIATLPVVLDACVAGHLYSLVVYIGADALLYFLLALFWLLWLKPWSANAGGAVVLGAVGGLAACAKVNGAFVLCGAALWYASYQKGLLRLLFPLLMLAVATAVFVALNPVFLGGGFHWEAQVLRDLISNRVYIKNAQLLTQWGSFSHWETIVTTLPHLFLAVPAIAVALPFRREWWFPATAFWSVSVIALNLAMLYLFMPRYAAPVRMAFVVLLMASGMRIVQRIVRGRAAAPAGIDSAVPPGPIASNVREEPL